MPPKARKGRTNSSMKILNLVLGIAVLLVDVLLLLSIYQMSVLEMIAMLAFGIAIWYFNIRLLFPFLARLRGSETNKISNKGFDIVLVIYNILALLFFVVVFTDKSIATRTSQWGILPGLSIYYIINSVLLPMMMKQGDKN